MKSNNSQNPTPAISIFKLFFMLTILVTFLAISITYLIPQTDYIKIEHLNTTTNTPLNSQISRIFGFNHSISDPTQFSNSTQFLNFTQPALSKPYVGPHQCVLWMAPFISGGGYCSEAWSYILALNRYNQDANFTISIDQHGDNENLYFWEGLPTYMKTLAFELYETKCKLEETIVILHSEPGAWNQPLFQTTPGPPFNTRFTIGRTMFETDRVTTEHVKQCNAMDMVWVPTEFHVDSFVKSGVDPSKVVKVVQAIDTEFFDPNKYKPLKLASLGNLVLGSGLTGVDTQNPFVFLSVFKWEYRKGWDVLLQSYLREFDSLDKVNLYILTHPYHSGSNFGNKIVEFVEDFGLEKPINGWPAVYVIDSHIAQADLPKLYKAADAFVLPSRGEGWGRPIVEAMAVALPVIATNWSGPTEYLTEKNSYPLPVDRMSEVIDGPFKGHLWAEPSVDKLSFLMRHVLSNQEEAKSKGKKARDDMIDKYSPKIVAKVVSDQIHQIINKRYLSN